LSTRRSLVEAALRREKSSRIPCFPLVDIVYAAAHCGRPMAQLQLDPAMHADALSRCASELPIDGVYVNLCLSREQSGRAEMRNGQYEVRLDDALDVRFAENDVAAIAHTDIVSLDDSRIESAGLYHPGMLETFSAIPAGIRDEIAVCVGISGTFSQIGFLYGLQNLMMAMVDRPEEVSRALDRRHEIVLKQAQELCAAGARFVWIGEGMASGSLISPALYRRFVLPYEQELAKELRRLGALSILHICGNIKPMLSDIAESEVDGADIDAPTDWEAAVKTLGPKISLKGNLNPILFLPDNVHQLASACETTLRIANALAGHILSTGCLVPRDSCREAFDIAARYCNLTQGTGDGD
jgi:uroporphyrinogen-III decarboxylase